MNLPQIICHCGKCDVKCNKHNKRAKCDDCKKRRMLGTVVEMGKMRHICNECCTKYEEKIREEENKRVFESLRKTKQEEEIWDNPLVP